MGAGENYEGLVRGHGSIAVGLKESSKADLQWVFAVRAGATGVVSSAEMLLCLHTSSPHVLLRQQQQQLL